MAAQSLALLASLVLLAPGAVLSFAPPMPIAAGPRRTTFRTEGPGGAEAAFAVGAAFVPRAVPPRAYHHHPCSPLLSATASEAETSSSSSPPAEYPSASDVDALRALFLSRCGEGGIMTKEELGGVPAIREMVEGGELLPSELAEIWDAVPKVAGDGDDEAIDVEGFVRVYRDVDDLFEDDDEAVGASAEEAAVEEVSAADATEDDADIARVEDVADEDLKTAFDSLAGDGGATIAFAQLRGWSEVASLIEEDGALAEEELVSLWEGATGVEGKGGEMDLASFVTFNDALDDLFEDVDEEDSEEDDAVEAAGAVEEEEPAEIPAVEAAPLPIVTEEDLPPGVLFSQLANGDYLIGRTELKRWGELNDMLEEGDLTSDELEGLFASAAKAPGTDDMLDEEGFCSLWESIDGLFEDEGEDGEAEEASPPKDVRELKEELLEVIEDIAKLSEEEGLQVCGLDCSELEQERVLEVVSELEREPYNMVSASSAASGGVDKEELVGSWDLLYSSSSTMKYNEGLSGLAGGLTRFDGLSQRFSATKYLSDVEYTEKVVGKLGGNSFEVKITGDWDLRTEVSLFTGRPSDVLSVTPDRVSYGPRSDKADHWKSLGPMNMLVLSYLDEDLRIMRGNTSTDTLFVWRRSA